MLEWQRTEPEALREFHTAKGDVEFTTDGTSVNTTEGWREVKLGIFSKRDRAKPATPSEGETANSRGPRRVWRSRRLKRANSSVRAGKRGPNVWRSAIHRR